MVNARSEQKEAIGGMGEGCAYGMGWGESMSMGVEVLACGEGPIGLVRSGWVRY